MDGNIFTLVTSGINRGTDIIGYLLMPSVHDAVLQPLRCLDILYLDTTYCGEKYTFPEQSAVINNVVMSIADDIKRHPSFLIYCGTYTIGKENLMVGMYRDVYA